MAFILLHLCQVTKTIDGGDFQTQSVPIAFSPEVLILCFVGISFSPPAVRCVVQRCSPCDATIHKPSDNVAIVDSQQKKEPNPEAEVKPAKDRFPNSRRSTKNWKRFPSDNGGCAHNTKTNSAPPAPTVFTNFGSSSIGRGACPSSR